MGCLQTLSLQLYKGLEGDSDWGTSGLAMLFPGSNA